MKMVVTNKVYTPEMFVEILTGRSEIFDGKDTISQIHEFLRKAGIEKDGQEFWDYPLDEIEHILSEKLNVVLVDVSGFYLNGDWERLFRWFEITGFEEQFQNKEQQLLSEYRTYFSISHKQFVAINSNALKHKELTLQDENFIITPFRDWYDILKEGRALQHNIVQVAKVKYAKGKNFIFAIRKVSHPNTPYISIEFDGEGRLVALGQKCCYPVTDERVRDFAERFRREVLLPYLQNEKTS